MAYAIGFKGESNGRIFQIGGHMHLCGNGLTVRVPSKIYHQRMQAWIDNRMQRPLVFLGDDGTRCTMTAPAGSGDVVVGLTR